MPSQQMAGSGRKALKDLQFKTKSTNQNKKKENAMRSLQYRDHASTPEARAC